MSTSDSRVLPTTKILQPLTPHALRRQPDNIMFDETGSTLKLVDFGLVCVVNQVTALLHCNSK